MRSSFGTETTLPPPVAEQYTMQVPGTASSTSLSSLKSFPGPESAPSHSNFPPSDSWYGLEGANLIFDEQANSPLCNGRGLFDFQGDIHHKPQTVAPRSPSSPSAIVHPALPTASGIRISGSIGSPRIAPLTMVFKPDIQRYRKFRRRKVVKNSMYSLSSLQTKGEPQLGFNTKMV